MSRTHQIALPNSWPWQLPGLGSKGPGTASVQEGTCLESPWVQSWLGPCCRSLRLRGMCVPREGLLWSSSQKREREPTVGLWPRELCAACRQRGPLWPSPWLLMQGCGPGLWPGMAWQAAETSEVTVRTMATMDLWGSSSSLMSPGFGSEDHSMWAGLAGTAAPCIHTVAPTSTHFVAKALLHSGSGNF